MAEQDPNIPPRPHTFSASGTTGIEEGGRAASRNSGDYKAVTAPLKSSADAIDARSRVITVRRLKAIDFYRLTKILGSAGENQMGMASAVATVQAIDGEPVFFPQSELEIEALIQRLDFDGIAAINEGLKTLNETTEKFTETAKN